MSENAENAAKAAEAAQPKERKSLDPRIAFALMVIMICCALCIGANKAWRKNRAGVEASLAAWQESVAQRMETAYNILTVGGRYLASSDALMIALREDISGMQSAGSSAEELQRQADASARFLTDGAAALAALAADSRVRSDARDTMYATLMLPQALEQCQNDAALSDYNSTAKSYNEDMRCFSGLLARLTGVSKAPIISAAQKGGEG